MVQSPDGPLFVECYCLVSELDRAIPALFELPGIPVPDSQINLAITAIKRMAEVDSDIPLHFKAKFDQVEGSLIIFQVVKGNRTPRTIARRSGRVTIEFLEDPIEFLDPVFGLKGLPTRRN